jgi:hypothetical protein
VWSANRTRIVTRLIELGQHEIAADIIRYYEAAWRFFLSGRTDTDSGREAFGNAIRMLKRGSAIGTAALAG